VYFEKSVGNSTAGRKGQLFSPQGLFSATPSWGMPDVEEQWQVQLNELEVVGVLISIDLHRREE